MSRDPETNRNLPPWLREVPLPPRPSQGGPAAGAAPAAGEEPVPDWLREMGAATGAPAGAAPLPSWLQDDEPPAPPPAPPAGGEPEQVPDWLRSLAADTPAPAAADDTIPDWLREPAAPPAAAEPSWLSPPADQGDPSGAIPDWLSSIPEVTPPAPAGDPLPDWLRPAGEARPPAADETPDWLRPTGDAYPPAADETPDWLRPASEPAAPTNAAEPGWLSSLADDPPPAPPPADAAEPGWLSSLAGDPPPAPQPAANAPDRLSGRSEPDDVDAASDIDLAPFSLDMIGEAPASPADGQPAPSAPPPGAPSWLDDTSDDSGAPPWLSIDPAVQDDAAPAWLRPPEPDRSSAPHGAAAPDDVPEWLRASDPPQGEDIPSWLQDIAPGQSAPAPGAPAPGAPAADIPPWLQDVAPDAASAPPSASGAPSADVPPWLQDVAPTHTPADLPDWLRAEASAPNATPSAPTPTGEQQLPDWLRADLPGPPAAPTPSEAPPTGLPDWLRSAAPAGPPAVELPPAAIPPWLNDAETSAPPAGEPIAPVGVPDWLREDTVPAPTAPAPSQPQGDAPDALPAWLTSDLAPAAGSDTMPEVPPWLRDESGQPLPTAAAPGEAGLPQWLRGAPSEVRAAAPQSDVDAPTRPGAGWFDEPDEEQVPAPDSGMLGGTELPAWLKVEPESKPDAGAIDTRSIDWLTRLGVQEEEAAVAVAAPAQRVALPRPPARSSAQIDATALLRRLAANPLPEIAPVPAPSRGGILQRIGLERALSLILLAALITALAVPSLSASLQSAPVAAGATELFQQIDQLDADDVVLVGYEWDARRASELRPLEQAVIGHMIDRGVKLVLVSTDPQGTLLLFDLLDQLTAAGYAQNGEGYLLLGYKPGGELALRGMAQNLEGALRSDAYGEDATISVLVKGLETGRPLTSLNDFSMIVVMADDAPDVQAWMEQIRPPTEAAAIPMAFLLPSEAAPIIQPYVVQDNVRHLAGQSGALAYRALHGEGNDQIALQTGQLRLSALIFVALLLLGALAAAIMAAVDRRRGAA